MLLCGLGLPLFYGCISMEESRNMYSGKLHSMPMYGSSALASSIRIIQILKWCE